jgi:TrmH family RNA methyltransferase
MRPLKWYKELADAEGRRRERMFVAEGPRALHQFLMVSPGSIDEVVAAEGQAIPRGLPCSVRIVTRRQFGRLSTTRTPQGLLSVLRIPQGTYEGQLPDGNAGHVLLCEDVQDPGNVGTLIRTAAAFGFWGVVLSDKCADPFSPKCVQATAGSVLSLWVRRAASYLDLAAQLRQRGYRLVVAHVGAERDPEWWRGGPAVLALGSEGSGVSQSLLDAADTVFSIPVQTTRADSLNVAACGAVCMYSLMVGQRR